VQNSFGRNSKVFWRKVQGERKSMRIVLKDESGVVMDDGKEVAEWSRRYFQKLYNEGYQENEPEGEEEVEEILQELEEVPTRVEIHMGIRRLKNGKAAGYSGIVGELLKAGGEVLEERLVNLFKRVWEEEKIPQDWECGVVVPLFKKGDKMSLDNYRGITLMDVVGKVFSGILRHRLECWYEGRIAEEQAGFRKGRGCVDNSYTLAQVVQKRLEKQQNTYLCFVDLKKAYDSVWREGLFRKLRQDGVPQKLVKLVRMWYKKVRARVRVNDEESTWFETKVGVRQGDTLSPLLFNIFINDIAEKVKENEDGVRMGEVGLSILLFADDMVLMAEDQECLGRMVRKVQEFCEAWRLEVNVDKTKVMVVSRDGAAVKYGEEQLECVIKYPYLGTIFAADGKWEGEIERRRQAGRAALSSLSKGLVWNKCIGIRVKRCIFEMLVKSRLMYGGDVWWPDKKALGKLETVQNDFIRWVTGLTRQERVSVTKLRTEVGMESVDDGLCRKRLEWLGRLTRMDGNWLVSRVWGAECDGRRGRGRPWKTHHLQEVEDLARGGLDRAMALERVEWRRKLRQIGEPC
jgi:hypothetical protein